MSPRRETRLVDGDGAREDDGDGVREG